MYRYSFYRQVLPLVGLCVTLATAQSPVCPQQGATTITQMELVPRPEGIATLRCDFNVPPNPTHPDTGFLYIAWVIDTTSQFYSHLYDPNNNNAGSIQPGYEDLIFSARDNFHNLGQSPGSSIITLNVGLAIKNEFKCEVLLKNHQYCIDTTRIQFQDPDIAMELDGVEFCRNNGGPCEDIASGDHRITCRVRNSESDPPTMVITINGTPISSDSPVGVIINSHGYYDGVITRSYNIPENANCMCVVTDTRGTYHLASGPVDESEDLPETTTTPVPGDSESGGPMSPFEQALLRAFERQTEVLMEQSRTLASLLEVERERLELETQQREGI